MRTLNPSVKFQENRPKGKNSRHICGVEQVWCEDGRDRPRQGNWTYCSNCGGWILNDPMVVEGSGYDKKTRKLDISKQRFWCIRCGVDLN
jgi:hypothetical protein